MNITGPLMIDCEGLVLTEEDKEIIANPLIGGFILFSRNYETPNQLKELIKSIRKIKKNILIAVDQEGGRVQRFKNNFTKLSPLKTIGDEYKKNKSIGLEMAFNHGFTMASEIKKYDIDISFAPILDLDIGVSKVIGDRSFGDEPDLIINCAREYISGMNQAGMEATGKHFPGHGFVEADSHLDLPIDTRSPKELERDLEPFKKLISENKLGGIMPAHVVYDQVDNLPAGFSKKWCNDILRNQLGFNGLIFSDDLTMEGAAKFGSYPERAQLAKDAGCDVLIVCNNRAGVKEILAGGIE